MRIMRKDTEGFILLRHRLVEDVQFCCRSMSMRPICHWIRSFASLFACSSGRSKQGGTHGRDSRSYPRVSIASQTPRTTRLHYLYGLSKRIGRETRDSREETAETRDLL